MNIEGKGNKCKICFDKNNEPYFRFNKRRYYIGEFIIIDKEKVPDIEDYDLIEYNLTLEGAKGILLKIDDYFGWVKVYKFKENDKWFI